MTSANSPCFGWFDVFKVSCSVNSVLGPDGSAVSGAPLESTFGASEAVTLSFKIVSDDTACSEQVVELCDPLRFLPLLDLPAICRNLIPVPIYKHGPENL